MKIPTRVVVLGVFLLVAALILILVGSSTGEDKPMTDAEIFRGMLDAEIAECHLPDGEGRGIVMCAGGEVYLKHALESLLFMRRLGCTLPVEIVHADADEITEEWKSIMETRVGNVRFIDASKVSICTSRPPTKLRGYEIKAYAPLVCSFDEILLLDADCTGMEDPTILFDDPAYKRHGNLFWPDVRRHKNPIRTWMVGPFGPEVPEDWETESGQVVVSRNRCKRALLYAWLLNSHPEVVYATRLQLNDPRRYWGDKDLFRVGFNMTDTPYTLVSISPGGLFSGGQGVAFVQKAPGDGRPMFLHRHGEKRGGKGQYQWYEPVCYSRVRAPIPEGAMEFRRFVSVEVTP
jgi:alpha 1,2-mannosyltransferase